MKGQRGNQKADRLHQHQVIRNQEQSERQPREIRRQIHPPRQDQGHQETKKDDDKFISQKLAQVIFKKAHRSHQETVDAAAIDFFDHAVFVHPIGGDTGNEGRPQSVRKIIFFRKSRDGRACGIDENRDPQRELDQPGDEGLQDRVGQEIEAIFKIAEYGQAKEREIPSPKTGE